MYEYLRDPAAIYRQSFATVRKECHLERFPASLHPIVTRMVHACGLVEIAQRIDASDDFVDSAQDALRSDAPVYCDCQMLRHGIIDVPRARLQCTLDVPDLAQEAKAGATTRSAAAVAHWNLAGALIVIGNAPTALFALLEALHAGGARPAAIVGIPVGFVGAAESKQALSESYAQLGVPYITLHGRAGGSAIAASVVNALTRGTT